MPTINDLSKEYASYICLNQENPHAVSEIAMRITGLTYTSNDQPLSDEDTEKLISAISEEIRTPRTISGRILKEAEDITALLAMVDKIKAMVSNRRQP